MTIRQIRQFHNILLFKLFFIREIEVLFVFNKYCSKKVKVNFFCFSYEMFRKRLFYCNEVTLTLEPKLWSFLAMEREIIIVFVLTQTLSEARLSKTEKMRKTSITKKQSEKNNNFFLYF